MRRIAGLLLAIPMFLVTQVRSAEPSTPPQQTKKPLLTITAAQDDVTQPPLPECHVTFESSQEVLSVPIADFGKEQNFVAEFRLHLRDLDLELTPRSREVPDWAKENELPQLVLKMFETSFRSDQYARKDLSAFLKTIPEERRPRGEVFDPIVRLSVTFTDEGKYDERGQDMSWQVFAFTPERAKEDVMSLLSIYDYGLSLPMQRQFLRRKVLAATQLLQVREELEQMKVNIDEWNSQLDKMKDYEDVGSEALTTYHAQLRMINVELSGIKARIDACNKLLGQPKTNLPASRVEQIETIKTTAEIELVGLTAKKSAISTIVQNAQSRIALLNKVVTSGKRRLDQEKTISNIERNIARYIAGRRAWEACPLERETVTIRPIKWVASAKKSSREEK